MRRLYRWMAASAAAGALGVLALAVWPVGRAPAAITLTGDVQRGAYLARASGCIACHTDFAQRGAPLAGGVKLDTPFGALYAPNITTDPEHGIGTWTVEQFAQAVRQGIAPDGRLYYPAFTFEFYQHFTDQEIADLWAAFRTVAPVPEPSRDPEMPFPFNQRALMKLWRLLYLDAPRTAPVPGADPQWNRGKRLVEGAAHCGACHTGRLMLGARDHETAHFKGGTVAGKAPAIDAETLRDRGWTIDTLAYALRSGITPSGDAFGGAMGEVVLYGTQYLSDADLTAMAVFLLGTPQ